MFCFVDDGTSVMGKSWRNDLNFWDILMPECFFFCLFVFLFSLWCQSILFFLSCGKTALFLKSKSRASALKGENLPIWLALRCAILGRRTQPAPAIAENGGLSWNSVCSLPEELTSSHTHTNTPLLYLILIVIGIFEFIHVCFNNPLNCWARLLNELLMILPS